MRHVNKKHYDYVESKIYNTLLNSAQPLDVYQIQDKVREPIDEIIRRVHVLCKHHIVKRHYGKNRSYYELSRYHR